MSLDIKDRFYRFMGMFERWMVLNLTACQHLDKLLTPPSMTDWNSNNSMRNAVGTSGFE